MQSLCGRIPLMPQLPLVASWETRPESFQMPRSLFGAVCSFTSKRSTTLDNSIFSLCLTKKGGVLFFASRLIAGQYCLARTEPPSLPPPPPPPALHFPSLFPLVLFPVAVSGLRGADESELRSMVSEPRQEHLLLTSDLSLLHDTLPRLSRRVCVTASEPPRPVKVSQPGACVCVCGSHK